MPIGNTYAHISHLRWEQFVSSINKDLAPLVKEDEKFVKTTPKLFGLLKEGQRLSWPNPCTDISTPIKSWYGGDQHGKLFFQKDFPREKEQPEEEMESHPQARRETIILTVIYSCQNFATWCCVTKKVLYSYLSLRACSLIPGIHGQRKKRLVSAVCTCVTYMYCFQLIHYCTALRSKK